jgi:hypothetical protein
MLQRLSDHIANCLARAAEAKRRAEESTDPRSRADFLQLEECWNCLAQSYEFSERLERFLVQDHGVSSAGWEPSVTAPFDRDLQLAVLDQDGVHALVFPCRRVLGGWLDAQTKRRIGVDPTHWRDWIETA